MSLKIVLKPEEKIIIGTAVITGAETGKTELLVHNDVPILRQKDILTLEQADSPAKLVYFTVQCLYIEQNKSEIHQVTLIQRMKELQNAAPSTLKYLILIQEQLLLGKYYHALKECRKLIEYEKELLHVQSVKCLSSHPKSDN
jgi:flagellar protein FlbT